MVRLVAGVTALILAFSLFFAFFTNEGNPALYEEAIVPFGGTTYSFTIPDGEFAVFSGGPMFVGNQFFDGGASRGNIAIFSPGIYKLQELVAGHNWIGRYKGSTPKVFNVSVMKIPAEIRMRIDGMFRYPNCPFVGGCEVIQVIYVGPGGVEFFWTEKSGINIPLPNLMH